MSREPSPPATARAAPQRPGVRPLPPGERPGSLLPSPAERARRVLRSARDLYAEAFLAPYRSAIQREYLRERDAFLLLSFADLLGVPNPVHFYTLELYPELLEHFHAWHLRLGMPHAPEEGWRCC